MIEGKRESTGNEEEVLSLEQIFRIISPKKTNFEAFTSSAGRKHVWSTGVIVQHGVRNKFAGLMWCDHGLSVTAMLYRIGLDVLFVH